MKTIITSTLALFIFSTMGFAQANTELINDIKKEFERINNLTNLEIKDIDTGCGCGCGGVTAYYHNGVLVKVVDYYGHPESSEITEFYYKNGELIFVYDELETFRFEKGIDGDYVGYTEDKSEGRYYFNGNSLVTKSIDGNVENYVSDDIEKVLLTISEDNLMMLSNQIALQE